MLDNDQKIQRMIEVAKMYYFYNMTQNEIAKQLSISRPLVSKLLSDAISSGIVSININYPKTYTSNLAGELIKKFKLKDVSIITQTPITDIDSFIAEKSLSYLEKNLDDTKYLGVGWGSLISNITDILEKKEKNLKNLKGKVVPLIGNSNIPFKGFHSNELVKVLGLKTGLTPNYLFSPAFFTSKQEKEIFTSIENYREILKIWEKLDTAIISINSHPSVPDLATGLRFGNTLSEKKAVGNILSYYFDKKGNVINGDNDFSIEIPLDILKKVKKVIGIVPSNINKNAIIGVLNAKIITHLIISSDSAKSILND